MLLTEQDKLLYRLSGPESRISKLYYFKIALMGMGV